MNIPNFLNEINFNFQLGFYSIFPYKQRVLCLDKDINGILEYTLFARKRDFYGFFLYNGNMSTKNGLRIGAIAAAFATALTLSACGTNPTTPDPTNEPSASQSTEVPFELQDIILTEQAANTINYSMTYDGNPDGGTLTFTIEGTDWSDGPTEEYAGTLEPKVPVGTYNLVAVYTDADGNEYDPTIKEVTFKAPTSMEWEPVTTTGPTAGGWNAELKLHGAPIVTGSVQAVNRDGEVIGTGSVDSEDNVVRISMPKQDKSRYETITFKYSGDDENPEGEFSTRITWSD